MLVFLSYRFRHFNSQSGLCEDNLCISSCRHKLSEKRRDAIFASGGCQQKWTVLLSSGQLTNWSCQFWHANNRCCCWDNITSAYWIHVLHIFDHWYLTYMECDIAFLVMKTFNSNKSPVITINQRAKVL